MCVQSPKTLIQYDELPKFNGKHIKSIYAEYENSRYGTKKEGGGYIADILFYKCYVHDWDCGVHYGENRGESILKIKVLPKEFDGLFGMVENKGKKIFVTSHYFRMNDSCNGSFTDQTLDMDGWASNSTSGNFSLYRGCSFMDKPENTYVIDENSAIHNKWKKILGHSFKVKEIEFAECGAKMEEGSLDFATKYPYQHTPIRFIDGLVYPDEKLPSWRWHYGMPYRMPEGAKDKKYLRVWDEDLKVHLYLERADELEIGDEGLVSVTFRYEQHEIYGSKGNAYCHISRFNESYGFQYKTYSIVSKNKKDKSFNFECYRGVQKLKDKGTVQPRELYRITKRSFSNETKFD